ncbi:Lmo0850 family protein [Paenisporosarcina sp. TG20]|nr:Lmo0850 family protein [Paenisporosarcina sp. TG20]
MTKEVDLRKTVSNLSKLGVTVTLTKSRLEMLKALALPGQTPQSQG